MKKHFFIIAALAVITVSCSLFDKLDELTKFDLPYDTSVNIEASVDLPIPAGQTLSIPTPPITTNSEKQFEVNKTAKNLIEEIKLKELTLKVKTPEDGNFDFMNSIKLYISAEDLDDTLIASATDIPKGTTEINLVVEDVDLTPYITGNEISFKVKTVTGEIVTQNMEIDLHSVFHVDAKILGL